MHKEKEIHVQDEHELIHVGCITADKSRTQSDKCKFGSGLSRNKSYWKLSHLCVIKYWNNSYRKDECCKCAAGVRLRLSFYTDKSRPVV